MGDVAPDLFFSEEADEAHLLILIEGRSLFTTYTIYAKRAKYTLKTLEEPRPQRESGHYAIKAMGLPYEPFTCETEEDGANALNVRARLLYDLCFCHGRATDECLEDTSTDLPVGAGKE